MRGVGVDRLAPYEPQLAWQQPEASGEHESPVRRCVVHVGEIVAPGRHSHVRVKHHDSSRWTAEIDGVNDDQCIGTREQLLDQMNPANADLEDLDSVGNAAGNEPPADFDPEPVVATKDVPKARNDEPHPPQLKDPPTLLVTGDGRACGVGG